LAQCCTCVIRGGRGHTTLTEPSGQTSCYLGLRHQGKYHTDRTRSVKDLEITTGTDCKLDLTNYFFCVL